MYFKFGTTSECMKSLGIDYGTKRIGVAVSDDTGSIAFPLTTIKAGPAALEEIANIVRVNSVEQIILGESRDFKGQLNKVMEDIELFKTDIGELCGIPVIYEAEFLSSAQAARQYTDITQPRRRASRVGAPTKASGEKLDAAAAALILQSYLDKKR